MTYDNRDPYEAYTDGHNRRNWGEPVSYLCLLFLNLHFFQMPMNFMTHRADRNSYNGLDIEDFSL